MQNLPVEDESYRQLWRLHGRNYQSGSHAFFHADYLDTYAESSPSAWGMNYSRMKFYKRFEEHLRGVDPRDFSFPLEELKK